MMKRLIYPLIICLQLCSLAQAQTSRGIMATPDFAYNPAEGVYEVISNDLWLYTFGVSMTRANAYQPLRFPNEDCRRIEESVKDVFKYAYNVRVSHLDADEQYKSKKAIIEQLKDALAAAKSGDVVMLYFSGHGITASNPYVTSEYYFIPYDVVKNDPQSSALSGAEIRQYIDGIAQKGAKVLVFVDTCHSEAIYPLDASTDGQVAYFASCEAGGSSIENAVIESTEFTKALIDLLKGIPQTENLRVIDIASVLSKATEGSVEARVINTEDLVLLHSLDKKAKYHQVLEKYKYYVNNGRNSAEKKDYFGAFFEFYEARSLERLLDKRDRIDYSEVVTILNDNLSEDIEIACNDFSNPIWEALSLLDENTYYLDKEKVSLAQLFSGCGSFFWEKKDYPRSYDFFAKAYSYGDNAKAAYYLARIAESELSGRLSKKEVLDFYRIAKSNGYVDDGFEKIRNELILSAENGDTHSQAILGRCYYIGDTLGFKRDGLNAVKWLKIASAKKDPNAMRWLGHCYRDGVGVNEDQSAAYKLYKESYSLGSKLSGCYYAEQIMDGRGVKKNVKKGAALIKKFANEGLPYGQLLYGKALYYGELGEKNKKAGFDYMIQAALQSDSQAQAILGMWYGFDDSYKNGEQAWYWTNRSIEKNNLNGFFIMGMLYSNGIHVNKNDSLAIHYWEIAANKGEELSSNSLGLYYQYNHGTIKRDLGKALYWYKKSIEDGNTWDAPQNLNELYIDLGSYYLGWDDDSIVDYDKAFTYLSLADQGDYEDNNVIRLQRMLGRCYHRGYGVTINQKEALRRYQIASEKGSVIALNDMGLIYFEGEATYIDWNKAFECFKASSDAGDAYGSLNLGRLYKERGQIEDALACFEKASAGGSSWATELLGDYYYDKFDSGEFNNPKRAAEYYQAVLKQYPDYSSIKRRLGSCFYYEAQELYEQGKYDQANSLAMQALNTGYNYAWCMIGNMYLEGKFFEKDETEALRCYIKAYELGERGEELLKNIPSYYSSLFAELYNQKNYSEAFIACKNSVDLGETNNLYWLGFMFETGLGVEKDLYQAATYYEEALSKGVKTEKSKEYLARTYYNIFAEKYRENDFKTALLFCEKAVGLGSQKAQDYLPMVKRKAAQ